MTTIAPDQRGFLIPEHFIVRAPGQRDMLVVSIIWGFSLACSMFSAGLVWKQTQRVYKRQRGWNSYLAMIWAELIASTIMGIVSWMKNGGKIMESFWFYFWLLVIWTIQMQCISGIMVNRISLLLINRTTARRLTWAVTIMIAFINISVFVIWIPAHLQINDTWIRINDVWDRVEKGLFACVDLGLNVYFVRLIYTKLIANGLTKYMPLFKFNLAMAIFSLSLDVVLIGSMSIGNGFIYVQFQALVYLIKLHIEMMMADLLRKVVQASTHDTPNHGNNSYPLKSSHRRGNATATATARNGTAINTIIVEPKDDDDHNKLGGNHFGSRYQADAHAGGSEDDVKPFSNGITRIVQTTITSSRRRSVEHDEESSQSSTHQLKDREAADEFL